MRRIGEPCRRSEGSGEATPYDGVARPPAALRGACDALHHGAPRALPDDLAPPSYGVGTSDGVY